MEDKQRPFITIIVPVYNAQSYLLDCLNSVAAQTVNNFECILVDDGSIDESGAVCDRFAAEDPRFIVVHQANAGVSNARNVGLEQAKGEYIVFCDADDCISPVAFELALKAQAAHPEDMICWLLTRKAEDVFQAGAPAEKTYNEKQQRVYITTIAGHSNCNKLFRLLLIQRAGLRYDPMLSRAEDYDFGGRYLAALFEASPGALIRQMECPLYYWRDNPLSATHKKVASKRHAKVEWEPEEFHNYAQRMLEEYAGIQQAMNGWQGMCPEDLIPQLRTYLRRFAFSVWAAHQWREELPQNFFESEQIAEILHRLKELKAFTPYYLVFRLRLKVLIRWMYDSDDSGRMLLYRCMYTLTYYLLGANWNIN